MGARDRTKRLKGFNRIVTIFTRRTSSPGFNTSKKLQKEELYLGGDGNHAEIQIVDNSVLLMQ